MVERRKKMFDGFQNVPKFNTLRCQKILPLVYDDSLSYYEVLCKVADKTNKLIEDINIFLDWATEAEHTIEELNARVTAVENEIASFEAEIRTAFDGLEDDLKKQFEALAKSLTDEVDESIKQFTIDIQALIREAEQKLIDFEYEVDKTVLELTDKVNRAILQMKEESKANNQFIYKYVENRLNQFIDSFPEIITVFVHNPVRGYITNVETAIQDIYGATRYQGLTAYEYDRIGLTAYEYDSFGLTAREYDLYAKERLWKDPFHYMWSPFTGELTIIGLVVDRLASLHRECWTASGFDYVDMTADEWDSIGMTAYEYDWMSKLLNSLTAEEYDNLGLTAYEYDRMELRAIVYDKFASAIYLLKKVA